MGSPSVRHSEESAAGDTSSLFAVEARKLPSSNVLKKVGAAQVAVAAETIDPNSGLSVLDLMRKAARLNEIAVLHANVEIQAAMVMEEVSHDDLKLRASLPIVAKHPLRKDAVRSVPKVVQTPSVVKKKDSDKKLSGDDELKAMENTGADDSADSDDSVATIDKEADQEAKKSSGFIDKLLKHPRQAAEEHDFASNGESIQDFLSAEAKTIKKREGTKHFPSVHKILTREVAIESMPAVVKMVTPVSPVTAIGTDAVIDEHAHSDQQKNDFITSTDQDESNSSKEIKVDEDVMDQAKDVMNQAKDDDDEQTTTSRMTAAALSVPPVHSNTAALLHPFKTKAPVKPVASVTMPEGMSDPLSQQIKAAHQDDAQAANARVASQTDDQNAFDHIMEATGAASDEDFAY